MSYACLKWTKFLWTRIICSQYYQASTLQPISDQSLIFVLKSSLVFANTFFRRVRDFFQLFLTAPCNVYTTMKYYKIIKFSQDFLSQSSGIAPSDRTVLVSIPILLVCRYSIYVHRIFCCFLPFSVPPM